MTSKPPPPPSDPTPKRLQNDALTDPSFDVAAHELGLGKKAKKDFADEFQREVPKATELAAQGKLTDACELMLNLEKKARLGGDTNTCGDAALVLVKLCRRANDWTELNGIVVLIFKRRSQFKSVMTKVMQEVSTYVPEAPNRETELALIHTLRGVSEAKLFLEVERARLTRRLAQIKESEGDINQAADILQEESIENYGAMDKREKFDYLLEQFRLVLAKADYVRSTIISRKFQRKALEDPSLEDLKVRLYMLLIQLHMHDRDAFETAKAYLAIYGCAGIKADAKKSLEVLCSAAVLLALSPRDSHQDDELRRVLQITELKTRAPAYHTLLTRFVTPEISPWPLPEQTNLFTHELFKSDNNRWGETLHSRIVEHNIRVVANYYTRISISRLAEFLGLDVDTTEAHVARMVSSSPSTTTTTSSLSSSSPSSVKLYAKINRPAGVIVFAKPKSADTKLTELFSDVSSLLNLVEKTVHLVHKENMVHRITNGGGGGNNNTTAGEDGVGAT